MGIVLTIHAFLLSLMLAILSIPPIMRVARAKNLFEPFDERKVHTKVVPPLGGVAIFIAFVLSAIIATSNYPFQQIKYIFAAIIMMFFIGLKDDLIVISPRKKFIVQVLAALMLVILGDVQITHLHGILGLHQIPAWAGIPLSMFVILAVVNAWNLIDGIDGLASGLAIFASVFFGFWFIRAGLIPYAVMSFALAGSLTGFFFFNVFGHNYKLFMGDTGSLIIGLLMAVLAIRFNEFNVFRLNALGVANAPAVSFAVIAVPLLDTLRVITIRLLDGRSPFSADKNHTHHRLLSMLPTHLSVTLAMVAGNALLVLAAFLFSRIAVPATVQFLLVFCSGVMFCLVPSMLLRIRTRREAFTTPAVVKVTLPEHAPVVRMNMQAKAMVNEEEAVTSDH